MALIERYAMYLQCPHCRTRIRMICESSKDSKPTGAAAHKKKVNGSGTVPVTNEKPNVPAFEAASGENE